MAGDPGGGEEAADPQGSLGGARVLEGDDRVEPQGAGEPSACSRG